MRGRPSETSGAPSTWRPSRSWTATSSPGCWVPARYPCRPARCAWLGPLLGARALHPHFPLCSERALRRWRFLGYSATAWTVDDPDEARRLARAGCEGIMTNAPDVMLRVLGWSTPQQSVTLSNETLGGPTGSELLPG